MKTPDSVRRGLAAGDVDEVCAAIRACVDRLLAGNVVDPFDIADEVTPLRTHASSRVRRTVARACEHLPDPPGEATLAILREDTDRFVSDAAKEATKNRARRKKAHAKTETLDQRVMETLDQIGKRSKPMRKLAERAIWEREEHLLRQIHHELNKLLRPAKSALELVELEAGKGKPDPAAILRAIAEAGERVELLQKMLVAAVTYATTYQAEFREESLRDLLVDAFGQLEKRRKDPRLVCTNDIASDVRLVCDRTAMLSALQNVLQNAAEAYGDDVERVEIRASAKVDKGESEVTLELADSGPGMSPAVLAKVFNLFYTTKSTGTGLGLATTKRVIEAVHAGSVDIESERGRGTTVRITMPRDQPEASR